MTPNVWFALPQAVADMLVIGSYIPFTLHNFIQADQSPEAIYTYGWAIFTLFHAHFTVIFHTISIWLTVVLAVWRYLSVRLVGTQFEFFAISWHPFTPSQIRDLMSNQFVFVTHIARRRHRKLGVRWRKRSGLSFAPTWLCQSFASR